MQFQTFEIIGPIELTPRKVEDGRGYFSEIFRADAFAKRVAAVEFVQENQSLSILAGTVRGLHFQAQPFAQGKLVRCLAGKVFDVAVDLRTGSPTFGSWISVILTPQLNNQLWVPAGFAHGFATLEPNSVIGYRVTNYYSPEHDKGVRWDDPTIGVEWPDIVKPESLSAKDQAQPRLSELPSYFSYEG